MHPFNPKPETLTDLLARVHQLRPLLFKRSVSFLQLLHLSLQLGNLRLARLFELESGC
jgi:hypothetical protein